MARKSPLNTSYYHITDNAELDNSSSSDSEGSTSPNHLSWTDLLRSYSSDTQIRLCRSYASYLSLQSKANQKLNEPELEPTASLHEEQ